MFGKICWRGWQVEVGVLSEPWIDVHQNEQPHFCRGRHLGDRAHAAVAREFGLCSHFVAEVGLVYQHIHAADAFDVRGVGRGLRVGDIGQRAIGPIEPIADRTAGMSERKIASACRHPASGTSPESGCKRKAGINGNSGSENRCVRIASSFAASPWTTGPPLHFDGQHVEQVRQPDDMVEMGVREEDVEPLGRSIIPPTRNMPLPASSTTPISGSTGRPCAAIRLHNSRRCRAK